MSSRVVVVVLLVGLLVGGLSSIPEEQFPDTISADVKANSEQNMMSPAEASNMGPYSMYFADYFVIPSDVSEKQFGGDRSDEFLYPPDSYYKRWAEEEQMKDDMANNC